MNGDAVTLMALSEGETRVVDVSPSRRIVAVVNRTPADVLVEGYRVPSSDRVDLDDDDVDRAIITSLSVGTIELWVRPGGGVETR